MWVFLWDVPWLSPYILSEDPYLGTKVVELPSKVAKRITFEEQVTDININRLHEVVDKRLYLAILEVTTTI
jgi:DNA-directed RNA polymerase-5 subunit 1